MSHVRSKIELNDVENRLFTLLDECCTHLRESRGIRTECRIAGGWVRDKLLGKESNDIDVALSEMMGDDFARHLQEFAASRDVKTGEIAVINPNPEQSKHLQTARIPIFGLEVDLVNLRSEEYASGSRIPTAITFGTPVQDALRRDITINALFYNIHSRQVEDCTERGIPDLKRGLIRTPLPPRETFLDDPLRILRSLRFASRFGFEIDEELAKCVRDPEIQTALMAKVTRERVGEEVSKMMKGPDPLHAVELIHEFSLYNAVFGVLPPEVPPTLSAAIGPLVVRGRSRTYYRKKRAQSAIECAIRESLRLGSQNHFLDGIPLMFAAAARLKDPRPDRWREPAERVALGVMLREAAFHRPPAGERWPLAALFSLVQELLPNYDVENGQLDRETAGPIFERYNAFASRVEELALENVGDLQPIINGVAVRQALGATSAGPWMKDALAQVIEWQLANPSGTVDECVAWLKDEHEAGRVGPPATGERPAKRAKIEA
ncbi:tRNA nucleotidyltransferase [Mycena kentingensis (nom. inval.)]|nr:tRNA nucleotidyltransferase [Mycena kentingensis (nom. inval.)]